MEEVEEANRSALGTCRRVLSLLASSREHPPLLPPLAEETREAIAGFRRVSSMLSTSLGHARVRRGKKRTQFPFNNRIFLDNPLPPRSASAFIPLQLLTRSLPSNLESEMIELDTAYRTVALCAPQSSTAHLHFIQQQQSVQWYQELQEEMKLQGEMQTKSSSGGSGVNLKFNSNGTAADSFMSSLSMDVNLIGWSQMDRLNQHELHKRRCHGRGEDWNGKCVTSGKCHCSKKSKLRVKRSIRVPAISSKLADIPPDDYLWRKYGQKPIKGSPHPRGYYKCSSMRGCPARKHVEKCVDDPLMLIVTYQSEHNHAKMPSQPGHTS